MERGFGVVIGLGASAAAEGASVGMGFTMRVSVNVPVNVTGVLALVVVELATLVVVGSAIDDSTGVDLAVLEWAVFEVSSSTVEVRVLRTEVDVVDGSCPSAAVDEGAGVGAMVWVTNTVVVKPGA